MAWRLADHIEYGTLSNSGRNSVHGHIKLRGIEGSLMLELTGNCGADLEGKVFRFAPRMAVAGSDVQPLDSKQLAFHQIGPTGVMTAAHRAKVPTCSMDELSELLALGLPIEFEVKRVLYLEWYSQNGRMVIELPDPIIEYATRSDDSKATEWLPLPQPDWPEPFDDSVNADMPLCGPEITVIHIDDDGRATARQLDPLSYEEDLPAGHAAPHCDSPDRDLQSYLDSLSAETDRAAGIAPEEPDEFQREIELIDDIYDRNEPGEPLVTLFNARQQLPPADSLTEEQAEASVKVILARMALACVALHVCKHYTMLDVYKLLTGKFGTDGEWHPEIRGTGWVQNYATSDWCPECDREDEEMYKQMESKEV